MLLNLKGIGPEFAVVLGSEGLSRHFDNRRQVAAYAGPRADTLAERVGRLRPRGIESRQSKAANDADPDGLAMAAPSTAIGTHLVV